MLRKPPPKKTRLTDEPALQGRVIAHRDGFGFVQVDPEDLYLNKHEMRQVFNGDLVLVKPTRVDNRGRREGIILEVLERSTDLLVGQYLVDGNMAYLRPCLLYTSPSPRDQRGSRMPSSA